MDPWGFSKSSNPKKTLVFVVHGLLQKPGIDVFEAKTGRPQDPTIVTHVVLETLTDLVWNKVTRGGLPGVDEDGSEGLSLS